MEAGKKLDELVARHVLDRAPAAYSTDLNLAWQVTERVCGEGYQLQLSGSRIWKARFVKTVAHTLGTKAFEGTGSTPAEAICLAALSAKGVESR